MHNESCLNNIFTLMLYYVYEYVLSSNTSRSLSPSSCAQLAGARGKGMNLGEKKKTKRKKGKLGKDLL